MFQINDNNKKVLFNTQNMPNMIASSLSVKEMGVMLKFFESRSKVTITVM